MKAKSIFLLLSAALCATMAFAQSNLQADKAMRAEFELIMEKMKLDGTQTHEIGTLLSKRVEAENNIYANIDALNQRKEIIADQDPQAAAYLDTEVARFRQEIAKLREASTAEIKTHMNAGQVKTYENEVKPSLEKALKEIEKPASKEVNLKKGN